MFRPMTSDVSALSGVVAKGHQAMHFVSSTPSKIPYGGFSPVLQHSLYAAAWRCCLPCSGQDFYYRAFVGRVAPFHVGYSWMVHRHFTIAGFPRLDWQPYGLHTKEPRKNGNKYPISNKEFPMIKQEGSGYSISHYVG